MTHLSDTDQAPYSSPAPQTATVSDEAVQVSLNTWYGNSDYLDFTNMRNALTAALPHLALTAAPCSVEVCGLIWKDLDNGGSKCETDSKYSIDFWPREKMYVDAYTKMMRRKSLSEAKEAMQEQFERFFKPYIVTKPIEVAAVRESGFREGIEAAAKITDEFKANNIGCNSPEAVACFTVSKEMGQYIRALSPAEPVDQWQDIATAPKDTLVVVYTPPQPHDYPDAFHVDFDYIDTGIADDYWYNHGEAHEHFSCVGKPSGSIGGIPENAPYTHWMPLPAAPTSKGGE